MEIASTRETVNFTNKVNAVSPYNLGQVLQYYSTQTWVLQKISEAQFTPAQIEELAASFVKIESFGDYFDSEASIWLPNNNYVQASDSGKIPSCFLPSYVDDVLEYATINDFPATGETGKIYIALDTNKTYRWGGSTYVTIGTSLALGETSDTAYRGDRGKIAYDHSQTTGNPHGLTLSDLGILVDTDEINYLSGLSENIVTALGKKLDLSGGTMTGYITLHSNPTLNMHAANKLYVDNKIDDIGITSVRTRLDNVESEFETGGRVTSVENDIIAIQGSVNEFNVTLDKYYDVVQVDNDNKPLETKTYQTTYTSKFRGSVVVPTSIAITPTHTGITASYNITDCTISLAVNSSTAITSSDNPFVLTFTYYTSEKTYTNTQVLTLNTVTSGEDGRGISSTLVEYQQSSNGTTVPTGTWTQTIPTVTAGNYLWTRTTYTYTDSTTSYSYSVSRDGVESITTSATEPEDHTKLWLDSVNLQLKKWVTEYRKTSDTNFNGNTTYFKKDIDDVYTVETTHTGSGMRQTSDTTYLADKTYYSYDGTTYTELIEGTDYEVGDPIVGTVYEYYIGDSIYTTYQSLTTYYTYNEETETYTTLIEGTDYNVGDTFNGLIYKDYGSEKAEVYTYIYYNSWVVIADRTETERVAELVIDSNSIKSRVSKLETDYTKVESLETSYNSLITDTYRKDEITQITNGHGFNKTTDIIFQIDKKYYNTEDLDDEYTGVRTGNPNELGLYEYLTVTAIVSTQATFNSEGMHYNKTDAVTQTLINEIGVTVTKNADNSTLLFAGYDSDVGRAVVKAAELEATTYLKCGGSGRFEEYEDANGNVGPGFFLDS